MDETPALVIPEAVGAVAELLSWVALPVALVFALVAVLIRLTRGGWDEAAAVIVDGELRWMAADGSFHSAPAPEHPLAASADDLHVFYRTRRPDLWYPTKVAHDERTCRVIAILFLVIGIVSVVVSLVASLM